MQDSSSNNCSPRRTQCYGTYWRQCLSSQQQESMCSHPNCRLWVPGRVMVEVLSALRYLQSCTGNNTAEGILNQMGEVFHHMLMHEWHWWR